MVKKTIIFNIILGIYNNTITQLPFDINAYGTMSRKEKEESLRETVRLLAEESPRRTKRTIELRLLKPTMLAPYGFSPTVNAVFFSKLSQYT